MSRENEQAIKIFAKAIIDELMTKDLGYDKTRIALVKQVNANKTYTVNFDGVSYTNIKASRSLDNITIKENDIVRVTIPCGQYNNMYISSL